MAGVERKERTRKKMESQAKRTAECAPLVVSKAAGAYLPLPLPFLIPPVSLFLTCQTKLTNIFIKFSLQLSQPL